MHAQAQFINYKLARDNNFAVKNDILLLRKKKNVFKYQTSLKYKQYKFLELFNFFL